MKNSFVFGLVALLCQQTFAQNFVCPKTGLFPDPKSLNCAHYYKCVVAGSQQLVNVRHKCALNYVFNDKLKLCVAPILYRCPNGLASTTTAPPGPFTCPAFGNYPDKTSKDCKNYYICLGAGEWPRPATCPTGGIFNWDLNTCLPTDTFVCPTQ